MRGSGILYPIFSLSSRYGIGCFSKEAYDFIDFLKEAGQSYWQILPLGPTGFGDSPYQPFSSFAGNPYFICLEDLVKDGLLLQEELDSFDFGQDVTQVDYGAMYRSRYLALKMAFDRFQPNEEYQEFLEKESYWLKDYALFMTIKKMHDGKGWQDWEKEYKTKDQKALEQVSIDQKELIDFYYFQQYEFTKQWQKLREYAKEQEIEIIGDLPFYMALDSADVWASPEAFQMNEDLEPEFVAGTPPDAFSEDGQLWGNPVYDWQAMKKDNYHWWVQRIKRNYELYDIIRLDHFHGFCNYFAIDAKETTALNGEWRKGPGMDFFNQLEYKDKIIAEDLGTITKENAQLLKDSGFPGMKILQFAFGWSEDSFYLNHNHIQNCVVYTGNHDNPTTRVWIESINDHDRDFVRRYIHSENTNYGAFVWDFIREAFRSVADTCIIPLQDYLVKGQEARINTPGTAQGNWQWRLEPNFLSQELAASIYELTKLYGRLPKKKIEEDEEENQ